MSFFITDIAFVNNYKILNDIKTGLILASLLSIMWSFIVTFIVKNFYKKV